MGPSSRATLSRAGTVALGMLLIAVLAPLSQFLTQAAVNADVETATPVGWAVGLIVSMVLVLGVLRAVSRSGALARPNLVILYSMLTIAVPVMNLGLIRQLFLTITAAQREYFKEGNSTYRTACNALNRYWYPLVPTRQGLAWNKADRLLRLLRDDRLIQERAKAKGRLTALLAAEGQRLGAASRAASRPAATSAPAPPEDPSDLAAGLGVDEIEAIRALGQDAAIRSLRIRAALDARFARAREASRIAARRLPDLLVDVDEYEAGLLPDRLAEADASSRNRLDAEWRRMTPDRRAELDQRVRHLSGRLGKLRPMVTALSSEDYRAVRRAVAEGYLAAFARRGNDYVRAVRNSFLYRLTRQERNALWEQDGRGDAPNENLRGFSASLWRDLRDKQIKKTNTEEGLPGIWENFRTLLGAGAPDGLPWHIWVRPMVMWGLLLAAIFLLLMCLAEWFRRKWIERENLAFPLVDIADHVLRHDAALEAAEDLTDPPRRRWPVSGVFMAGFLAGAVYLGIEALGHYGFTAKVHNVTFDVSKELFTTGMLRDMDKVFLVVSPIVLGIAFLVSLELSFSVWVLFVLYKVVVMVGKVSNPDIRDSIYTGWSGGRTYPFPMAQFAGACLCFTAILLYKSFRTRARGGAGEPAGAFVPRKLNAAGLIVLPVAIYALLWHMGITNLPFLLLVSAFVMAQTIAAARVRAETGLPTHHTSYEFTKFPMVFGLTGFLGARAYTLFISVAFLPISLLFRTLPQHLENIELARRHRVNYKTVAAASLLAFLVAVGVGMLCFLIGCYYVGEEFAGERPLDKLGSATSRGCAHYPLWVSHFLGEHGLATFTDPHWIRIGFMALGFGVFGLLSLLRSKFLRFPLHPAGYLLILLSIFYEWVSPYYRGEGTRGQEACWIWGSVFLAWLVKKLIVKYGGMNTYKRAKPFFIGLVVGSVVCVFAWNVLDLVCSIIAERSTHVSDFVRSFVEHPPYSPRFY